MKKRFIVFLSPVLMLATALHSCMTFRMSDKEIARYFDSRGIPFEQSVIESGFRRTHYVKSGNDDKPLVLFVHGSPGSLSAFIDFLGDSVLASSFLLITADRPGFGYSNFGNAEPSLARQSALLTPILEKYAANRPVTLVGHSLGAPVVARMALDRPDLVDALVFIAGSIDPELEPNEAWFRAPFATPYFRWMLPRSIRASNDEIYAFKPQLESMIPMWKNIRVPVTVIQGGQDRLVHPGNADFAKSMITNAPVDIVYVDDMDHFVPWSHPQLVKDVIRATAAKVQGEARMTTPANP